ncbi:MAG: thiamine pyrophosphate-dependent enzyme [Victivallaceae bacterium]|nr:thiamine pyrophosphate-dependent enzyme [Victivallaceae bacterium]
MKLAKADKHPAWCPGCGNYPILETLQEILDEEFTERNNLVLVSGIGQAAKLPHYVKANVFNGLHGRALPVATGIKLANHELEVIVTSGDGDMYGEGGNHFVHAIRRNIGVKAIVHDNQVYGLTKGQASPTSVWGFETGIQIHGVKTLPFNPIALAIIEDCSLVARSFSGNKEHLRAMLKAVLEHKDGFALLDVLQPCVSFNHVNTFKWYKDRVKPLDESYDPGDLTAALQIALGDGDEIPIGIIYRGKRKSYELYAEALENGPLVKNYGKK